jgi:cell division cycle 14
MRIVRPGSVVGPQQQYMYLKQLEWVKWAAADELKKQQAAAMKPPAALVTPATPPADTDEEMDTRAATPPMNTVSLPPVTPSRHVATATAKAKSIAPPGQPRKTPKAKRLVEETEEEEENDALPALKAPATRNRSKTESKAPVRGVTASEQRPTRVTRSTAGAANIRRAGTVATTAASDSPSKGTSTKQGPNKIPRLATTRTTGAARAAATTTKQTSTRNPPSPIASRLPTLVPSKRPHHTSSLSEVTGTTNPLKSTDAVPVGWVNNTAVVNTSHKTERPNLRSVRRRRSSFSNADVVA